MRGKITDKRHGNVKGVSFLPETIFPRENKLPRKNVAKNGTLDAPRAVPDDAADDINNDDVLANCSRSRGSDVPASQALRSGLPR